MKHPKRYDTDESTSKRMANIRLKQGKTEVSLAKALWHKGFRYRLNYKKLPGSPDIAVQKFQIAIFIDGEFWHGYDWKNKKQKIKRNRDYWVEKIEENIARDIRVDKELITLGWVPLHFWSKDVTSNLAGCIKTVQELALDIILLN